MKTFHERIKSLPKADVHNHLHLSGSQKRFRKKYPEANLSFPDQYDGLAGMIDFIYNQLNTIMIDGPDVVNFMELAVLSAIDDKVTLLEASVDVGLARFFNDSIEAVIEATQRLKDKYKAHLDFKPDLGINKDLPLEKVYSDGVKCLESGIFNGIDLYGKEVGKDLEPFVRLYDMARGNGIKTKVHIGEFSDHHSIDHTINLLQPDEIQHGIRAVDSQRTMALIAEKGIRLNVCPTSNLALGAVKDMTIHPVRALYDFGINITINTDDLILFDATVSDEFIKLEDHGLFSADELETIRLNAF